MKAYLDTSVIVPYFIPEPCTPVINRFVRGPDRSLIVSTLAAGEFASAISRLLRMNLLSQENAVNRLTAFDGWLSTAIETIEIEAADVRLAGMFVRRLDLGLKMPDAIHAAVCRRHGLTLVTRDGRLDQASQVLGISTEIPA
nr:type II toxin-antitoxin system VapC family toxin [Polymorphobacter sp.]